MGSYWLLEVLSALLRHCQVHIEDHGIGVLRACGGGLGRSLSGCSRLFNALTLFLIDLLWSWLHWLGQLLEPEGGLGLIRILVSLLLLWQVLRVVHWCISFCLI